MPDSETMSVAQPQGSDASDVRAVMIYKQQHLNTEAD